MIVIEVKTTDVNSGVFDTTVDEISQWVLVTDSKWAVSRGEINSSYILVDMFDEHVAEILMDNWSYWDVIPTKSGRLRINIYHNYV